MRLALLRFAVWTCVSTCIGCGSTDDADEGTSTVEAPLVGNWEGSCEPTGNAATKPFISVNTNNYTAIRRHYGSADCTTEIFYSQAVSRIDALGKDFYDVVGISRQLTVVDSDFATAANQQGFCGYEDWVVGTAKDVNGKTCEWHHGSDKTELVYILDQTTYYGSYRVQDKMLLIAASDSERDGTRPDRRPNDFAEGSAAKYSLSTK